MVLASFIAGVLVGAAAILISTTLRARMARGRERLRPWLLGAAALVAVLASVSIMYARLAPRSVVPATVSAAAMGSPSAAPAQSMDTAVAGLEARLARGEGSDADWTLLAQAYEFLGRPEDAQRARQHVAGPAAPTLSVASLSAAAAALDGQHVPGSASDPSPSAPEHETQSWLALADARRAQRDFAGAREAYEKAIAARNMTAQSWADYADTVATLDHGSLSGTPAARAIDQALALDPNNVKGLWLKASQAHEQRHYSEALVWWNKLRAVLPPASADTRVIDGNIAEDRAAACGGQLTSSVAAPPAAGGAVVTGTVSLDGRYADRIGANATLFIYAKSADSPGPPLAVLRTTAANWPVSFRLDDSLAMLPSRKLSQFERVVVEARVSRAGQAMPASGDLVTVSPVVRPAQGKKLALVIDHEIG